ncbi:MAG: hypothetical protein LBF15_04910 [Candidatus Peribacteria bacterium]|jgi:hypothetical protein|nr:hypothetical protein [Candidatus Peribacteria bacterium]
MKLIMGSRTKNKAAKKRKNKTIAWKKLIFGTPKRATPQSFHRKYVPVPPMEKKAAKSTSEPTTVKGNSP